MNRRSFRAGYSICRLTVKLDLLYHVDRPRASARKKAGWKSTSPCLAHSIQQRRYLESPSSRRVMAAMARV